MQTQLQEEVDTYRMIDFSEQALNAGSKKKERKRRRTQYYQVEAAVSRERETRERLNKAQRERETLKSQRRDQQTEILMLEARKFEDDKTISELRKELQAARRGFVESRREQQQQTAASDEVVTCRDSRKCKKRKEKLKRLRAQRDVLRDELDGVRKERVMELEKVVDREEPYLIGVFRLMRKQVDDLRKENDRLVEMSAALISVRTT
ncbi:hypothetical protein AC579_8054 [Pseudocercospora musae]|uniref:Uncharacterized protein n=1 Tax=Pseudocercospora musae TaxID=113226 RepID=A0A139IPD1_9PEZI|nr:hypothetical protein AC579_8054 [Pseudocercospora musae]